MSRQWYILTMRFALSACVVILQDIVDRHVDHIHRLFSRWINVDEMSILKNEEHLCGASRAPWFRPLSPEVLASLPIQSVEQWWPSGVQLCCQNTVHRYVTATMFARSMTDSAKSLQNSLRRFGRITGEILMELSFLGVGIWRPLLASKRDCCNLH